jgi:hypothetical protein
MWADYKTREDLGVAYADGCGEKVGFLRGKKESVTYEVSGVV